MKGKDANCLTLSKFALGVGLHAKSHSRWAKSCANLAQVHQECTMAKPVMAHIPSVVLSGLHQASKAALGNGLLLRQCL